MFGNTRPKRSSAEGAWAVDADAICLAHGGPFAEPEDTAALTKRGRSSWLRHANRPHAQGFVGASSIERIPVEKAVMGALQGSSRATRSACVARKDRNGGLASRQDDTGDDQ